MDFASLNRWIEPLKRRVSIMVGKAIITAVNDSNDIQTLQVSLLGEEVKDGVERIQQAGLTTVPLKDGEAVAICIGGERDNMLIIATDSAATRPKGLAEGDVCLYHVKNPENKILLTKDGVEIIGQKTTINGGGNTIGRGQLIEEIIQDLYNDLAAWLVVAADGGASLKATLAAGWFLTAPAKIAKIQSANSEVD